MAIYSFNVADTIAAYRGVIIASTNTVSAPTGATGTATLPIGITVNACAATATGVSVAGPGEIARLYFNDSVTSGSIVGLDTSGRGIPITTGATSTAISICSAYVGVLVDAKVNSTGTIARVLIMPGLTRGTA